MVKLKGWISRRGSNKNIGIKRQIAQYMRLYITITILFIISFLFYILSPLSCSRENLKVIPPWPAWAFSHWLWEGEEEERGTQEAIMKLVEDYLYWDIPVGVLVIDSPWETCYNSFEFDKNLFPDPKGFIEGLHSKGIRVLLWINTMINTDCELYDETAKKGFFLQTSPDSGPVVIEWWKGYGSMIDYFNPKVVTWWHGLMDKALALGIDGWKCDGTDFFTILAPYSPGTGRYVERIEYSHAYYRDFFNYTRGVLGDDRIITARPVDNYGIGLGQPKLVSFAPRDINWAGWVGDQDATFDGLKAALDNMYHSSLLGYVAFGSDIGGYRDEEELELGRTKELFIRWAQLGAFCPVMENGGGGEHRPWMFDEETNDIYRLFTKIHYSLIDYLMEQGSNAWEKGESLMTFLNKTDYTYLLGPDILVAPMIISGTSRTVNFPSSDDWAYLFNKSRVFMGGSTATIEVSLSEFPVFLRKGSELERCECIFIPD